MYPELFHLGPVTIRAYGLMLALSFFLGILFLQRIANKHDKPFEPFLAMAYISIIGGVVGARLFYVLFHLDEFSGNWVASFNPFQSEQVGIAGLNLYGGVVLAIVGIFIYCRYKKLSVLEMFDYFAPTVGLGLAVTRIGCFLNGCCYGTPTELPWGVQFPEGSMPFYTYGHSHIHPAQIYSSLYGILIFFILNHMLNKRKFNGQIVSILFMVEAFFRFIIEYVRYYEDAMTFKLGPIEPTYNQVISISLFLLGLGIYIYQKKQMSTETVAE